MSTIEQILKKELRLSDDMCNRFLGLVETKRLKERELFVQQGKVCYSLGIVENGVLRSYIEKDAIEFIEGFYFPDSIVVSYGSLLTGEPSIRSIQALGETYLITLSRSSCSQLLQESSERFKFGKYTSDSLLIRKYRRETSFLMDNAFERYKLLLKAYPQVEQHLSRYYIAAYLGTRPESLGQLKSLNMGQ